MYERMHILTKADQSKIHLDSIKSIGIGHEYLTHPKTLAHCRTEFYLSDLMSRDDFTTWRSKGKKLLAERLQEIFQKRMNEYVQPDIAPEIVKDLKRYVQASTG